MYFPKISLKSPLGQLIEPHFSYQVLIQGCMVNEDNVEALVELLRTKLDHFESSMAEHMSDLVNVDLDDVSSSERCLWGIIPAWISNYIHYNVWDEITFPFPNFNGSTVEV